MPKGEAEIFTTFSLLIGRLLFIKIIIIKMIGPLQNVIVETIYTPV